jgi:ferredoxin-NADP reductase
MSRCTGVQSSTADRWLPADRMAMWEEAKVAGVERAPSGTVLRLRLDEVPDVLPGQYYLVRVAVDEPPGAVEQAYSLCSSPYPPSTEVEIAVREIPGGRVSPLLARRVEAGDLLHLRGPFGFLTWTERDGGPLGLVGAGTGVAPMVSIVRYAAARQLAVPMTLLCSSRDRTTALLLDELEALALGLPWFKLVCTYTRCPHDQRAGYRRRIDTGMLAEVFETHEHELRSTSYYVAGPGNMVISIRSMLGSLGVADHAIYSEDHA